MATASPLNSALRQIKPGDMVVSLTDLIAQLGDKLSNDERQALWTALLARRVEAVRPGDLITSSLVNQVLVDIEDLQQRLARLENATASDDRTVLITAVRPAGDLMVGSEVAIDGRNFEFSIGGCYVAFGGHTVQSFKRGSRDDRLIVDVPDLGAIPEAGLSVALTVFNTSSSDSRLVNVKPVQIPLEGKVELQPETVTPNPPEQNKDALFSYLVASKATRDATFKLSAMLADANDPLDGTSYAHLVTLLDGQKQPLLRNELSLSPNRSARVFVRVAQLPFAKDFRILLRAAAGKVSDESLEKTYTVGKPDTEDDQLELPAPSFAPDLVSNGVLTMKKTSNPVRASTTLALSVKAIDAGVNEYDCAIKLALAEGSGWPLQLLAPPPDAVGGTSIAAAKVKKGQPLTLQFAVKPGANPSALARAELTVVRAGQPGAAKLEKKLSVRLALDTSA